MLHEIIEQLVLVISIEPCYAINCWKHHGFFSIAAAYNTKKEALRNNIELIEVVL